MSHGPLNPPKWSTMEHTRPHLTEGFGSTEIREGKGGCFVYTAWGSVIVRGNSKQVTKTPAFTGFFPNSFFSFSTSWFHFLLLLNRDIALLSGDQSLFAVGRMSLMLSFLNLADLYMTYFLQLKVWFQSAEASFLTKLTNVQYVRPARRTFSLVWKEHFKVKVQFHST